MTLRQEAYSKIDQMSDDGIRFLIDFIDKMQIFSAKGFKKSGKAVTNPSDEVELTKEEKKKRFLESAGTIEIDAEAVEDLRQRSMI